VTLLQTLPE